MSDPEIVFEDPPTPRQDRTKFAPLIAAVVDRPGEWAKWPERAPISAAYSIKRGRAGFPPGSFETRAMSQKDGQCDLYVRYVGHLLGGATS